MKIAEMYEFGRFHKKVKSISRSMQFNPLTEEAQMEKMRSLDDALELAAGHFSRTNSPAEVFYLHLAYVLPDKKDFFNSKARSMMSFHAGRFQADFEKKAMIGGDISARDSQAYGIISNYLNSGLASDRWHFLGTLTKPSSVMNYIRDCYREIKSMP
jgi:hypothetical protein